MLFRGMSIQTKLILLVLVVTIVPMLVIANIGYTSGRDGLEESASRQLVGLRDSRADQFKTQVKLLRSQAIIFSEDRMFVDAMREFRAAYRKLDRPTTRAEMDGRKLDDFYQKEFLPELAKKVEPPPVLAVYLPRGAAARYLQHHYIAANSAPYFKKDSLDDPHDGSEYSALHRKYHPLFRNLAHTFGYQDLMLIDSKSGDIVYTVQKTTEFGTNLLNGPYSETNLAEMFRSIRKVKDPRAFQFAAYEPYRPNLARPTSFVSSPIADGSQIEGILVFQFPLEALNRRLLGELNWERDGLGRTGEVYVVGPDHLMRSLSRFYQEDPEAYFATLRKAGYSATDIDRIRRAGTTILAQEIHSEPVEKALAGQSGVEVHTDYRGKQALAAYAPLEVGKNRWAIVAKLDLVEAYRPSRTFGARVAIAVAVITLVASLLAIWLSSMLVRPIYRLIDGARAVSAGKVDVQVAVTSQDEFRELAETFNEMMRSLKQKSELLEQKVRENEELLLNILPGSAAARHKLGEQISESHADVTVLLADVVGFNELVESMPDRAVGLLNDLVVAFDEAAQQHGVEKVKTVGASYMAVCGLSVERIDHSRGMIEFAQEMLRIVRRFDQERGVALGIQISINAGPVLGGVVGRTRFIYDLWGDTVTVARRLHAGGEVNTIRVTKAVYDRLHEMYSFEGPNEVDVPGKGKLAVWSLKATVSSAVTDVTNEARSASEGTHGTEAR
jgi:class 3 adenylate cyclase